MILIIFYCALFYGSYFRIYKSFTLSAFRYPSTILRPTSKLCDSFSSNKQLSKEIENNDEKKLALDLLDCLTSSKDSSDPDYDVEKDIRRDNLLLTNDYHNLKLELKERGLPTSGDKIAMITRLLLHIIDPNIDYNEA